MAQRVAVNRSGWKVAGWPEDVVTACPALTSSRQFAPIDEKLRITDPVWTALRVEAWSEVDREPSLRRLLLEAILDQSSLEVALSQLLAAKLSNPWASADGLQSTLLEIFSGNPEILAAMRQDLAAIRERDPVAGGVLRPFLFFKGFHALQAYRVTHGLWQQGRELLAVQLQNRISEVFGVDIHPAARIGAGVMMDHATSIVIGETSVIEDNVSILHEVTLGGTGKETGDRHPKVRHGVLIGAGAKLLGNIEIGADSKIGAGSVVLDSVPPQCTVAGVPARIVGRASGHIPALEMDQVFPHLFEDGSGI